VSCALYLLLVQRLVNWSRPSNAIFATQRTLKLIYMVSQTYAPQLAAFNELLAWKDRTGSGYVLDSFWSAWDAFADAAGYEETIRRAIAPGGDTDTTAAIAGSLAGAHWGWEAIPREWLRGMRGREIVTPLVDRLVEREAGVRTSTGSPLRVDPVDLAETSLAGAGGIGITFLPGKKLAGRTGPHWRDLDADVASLRGQGTGALLLLVEDGELESAMVQDLPDVVAAAGIDLVRFPIPDPRTPTDTPGFRSVIRALAGRIRSGERVVVACRGGLDRSGMAAACILREGGLEASPAMERVRVARSGALTREEQIHFVIDWVAGT
jgi:protein-tyrosine phosphatase